MAYNMVGYAPAPMFYGLISKVSGGDTSRVPMGCLLYSTIFTVSLFLSAMRTKLNKEAEQSPESREELVRKITTESTKRDSMKI